MSGKQDLTRQEEFKRATAGALRAIAQTARSDARVDAVMTGVGDGLLICRKV